MGWDPDAPSLTCAEAQELYEKIATLESMLESRMQAWLRARRRIEFLENHLKPDIPIG